jgi:hypothetical protein
MSLAVVAEPDALERARCMRILVRQTPFSAFGAASWEELECALEDEHQVELVVFNTELPGAPEDAVEQLLTRAQRLVITPRGEVDDPNENPRVSRTAHPITEEKLVLLARSTGRLSTEIRMNFMPVDLIQMICMSGDSQVLIVTQDGADTGVIEVRNGEVWTAFDGMGVGEEAFARLIRPEMRARISPSRGTTKERSIFGGLHELVLESSRRIDEGHVLSPPKLTMAQLEAVVHAHEANAARVRELSLLARRLLMERNYNEAVKTLGDIAELDPTSQLVRANLDQLKKLGYPK